MDDDPCVAVTAFVKVYPHRLRHTTATQLLNAGCRVTSIQKFLGHKRLNSTMVYARVHDQTVADDYYAATDRVEQRLQIAPPAPATEERTNDEPLNDDERGQILDLADQLAAPDLSSEGRLDLVERIRLVLNHNTLPEKEKPIEQENGRRTRAPPAALSRLPLGNYHDKTRIKPSAEAIVRLFKCHLAVNN